MDFFLSHSPLALRRYIHRFCIIINRSVERAEESATAAVRASTAPVIGTYTTTVCRAGLLDGTRKRGKSEIHPVTV